MFLFVKLRKKMIIFISALGLTQDLKRERKGKKKTYSGDAGAKVQIDIKVWLLFWPQT